MDEYLQDLAQELVDEAHAQGNDDLATAIAVLLGDHGIFVEIPQGEDDANITH